MIGDVTAAKTPGGGSFESQAKGVLLNMRATDEQILKFISSELSPEKATPEKQQLITYLLSMRTQLSTTMSNVLRALIDGGNSIIRNIRA